MPIKDPVPIYNGLRAYVSKLEAARLALELHTTSSQGGVVRKLRKAGLADEVIEEVLHYYVESDDYDSLNHVDNIDELLIT